MEEIKKAKTHKGRMHLAEFDSKVIENPKECLFLNTKDSSDIMRMVLSDLYLMRRDLSKRLNKKNENLSPFDDANSIQFLNERNNTSLFTYTSDKKKKPMNLIFGSLFGNKILDLFEYEVTNYIPIEYFKKQISIDSCMKPIVIFQGDVFETDFQYERLKTFFFDYFRLHDIDEVNVSELRRIIIISSSEDKLIKIRSYQTEGNIKENNLTNISLTEVGPSLDLKVRRIQLANEEFFKKALKQPKELKVKKVKNIENVETEGKKGRIWMSKQNVNAMALKKYKKSLGRKRFNKENKKEDKDE